MSSTTRSDLVDSGVVWLGAVPRNWVVRPLKYVASFQNGCAFKPTEWSDEGIPIIRIENLNGGGDFNCFDGSVDPQFHVREGSLVFGWSGNKGTSFGPFRWQQPGLHYLNQHIFKVTGRGVDPTWLYWALRAVTFYVEEEAHGIIGMVHITKGRLGAIPVPIPSSEEQQAIAFFLDRETARIDGLIAKKRRLIELLREKRQAVISHAVTKGLDPNAPMKDSDIEWLGEIPAHWEAKRLKHLIYFIEQGWSPQCEERRVEGDEWGVLKTGCVNGGEFDPNNHKALPIDIEPIPALEVRVGDIIMSRASGSPELIGSVARVEAWQPHLMLSDKLYRLWPRKTTDPAFLVFALQARSSRWQIERVISGAGGLANNIPQSAVMDFRIAEPPEPEQRAIRAWLRAQCAQLDASVGLVESAIVKLEEHRATLISAAVTGKIDVRSYATGKVEAAE